MTVMGMTEMKAMAATSPAEAHQCGGNANEKRGTLTL